MLERRKTGRLPVFIGGFIKLSEDRAGVKCLIRNRSKDGAMLVVENSNAIPDEFDLAIPQQQATLRARTRWRGYDHLGVEFLNDKERIAAANADVVRLIKRLELENRRLKRRLRNQP